MKSTRITGTGRRGRGAVGPRRRRPVRNRRFDEFRRRLIAEQHRLLSDFERSQGQTGTGRVYADPVDQANVEEEIRTALQALNDESDTLAQIESALAKLADGRYGLCEECGRPIAPARLLAVPSRLCAAAARRPRISPQSRARRQGESPCA